MKTRQTPFSYVVLRYMHDVFTREFVNVGVLLYAPKVGFLGFEKLSALDRVKGTFPGLQSGSLRDLLGFLQSRAADLHGKTLDTFDQNSLAAETIAKSLLPTDDSALQWSTPGGGITANPEQTLKELFERLITRHEKAHPPTRREDADVWKPFQIAFRKRDILSRFQEKTLSVGELRHRFENAWQPPGGYLRLFQPLSFDLAERSNIVEKAVHWSALLRQFRKVDSGFHIYLIMGRPSDKSHLAAFNQAYETLAEENSGPKELVQEDDALGFAEVVEKDLKAAGYN